MGAPDLLNGCERALAVDLWSEADRAELRDLFLARYAASLEEAGIRVTSSGIMDQLGKGAPSTRSLDKEVRLLRREVTVLGEILQQLLKVVVLAGGCTAEQLRDFMRSSQKVAMGGAATESPMSLAPRNGDSAAAAEAPVAEAASETLAEEPSNGKSHAAEPAAESVPVRESRPEEPAVLQEAELEVDEEEEEAPVLASRLRRHPAPASTGPIDPARLRRRPVETRTMSSVPLDTMSSTRTKTCPRCKKQVPARVPRCLACGRLFS